MTTDEAIRAAVEALHSDAVLIDDIIRDPIARSRIDTADKAQELINYLEEYVPHDQLPRCYEWLISTRNRLIK